LAVALIHTIANCEADAVKVSVFTPDDMTVKGKYSIEEGLWKGDLYELYEKTAMPIDWIPELKEIAESDGLKFICGVYHPDTVKVALDMGIRHFKIASFEVGYQALLDAVSRTCKVGRTMVLEGANKCHTTAYVSLGSATINEIKNVVKAFPIELTLLHCVSQYPSNLEDMNLKTIRALKRKFKRPVGLSDHSIGCVAPVTAVSLGASVIEKHIMLDGGMDKEFALEPSEFYTMVQTVRAAERALGKVTYGGKKTYHRKEVDGKWIRVVR
jgi:sialic acid synthase SpsE